MSLFADSSAWDQGKTKEWGVSGGGSLGAGAVYFGEAKIFNFHNKAARKKKSLLLVSGGVGAKLELKFKAGSTMQAILDAGTDIRDRTNALGNPASTTIEKLTVHNSFSLRDLALAKAVGISAGADGGVVGTAVTGLLFFGRDGKKLFTLTSVVAEAIIGAGINMGSLQGGVLIDLNPTPRTLAEMEEVRRMKRRMPSHMHRPHAGKI